MVDWYRNVQYNEIMFKCGLLYDMIDALTT